MRLFVVVVFLGVLVPRSGFGNAIAEDPSSCRLADSELVSGHFSEAITLINQCLSDGNLSAPHYACTVLKRARAYYSMGQTDKSGGDARSALSKDPSLAEIGKVSQCLSVPSETAQSIIQTANNN